MDKNNSRIQKAAKEIMDLELNCADSADYDDKVMQVLLNNKITFEEMFELDEIIMSKMVASKYD